MEPYDLEIGPVQTTFEHLTESLRIYFDGAPVAPEGSITETSFSAFNQEQLHKTLNSVLVHYGFNMLPAALKIAVDDNSTIGGIYRSDNITIYKETLNDGSEKVFNFYSTFGPENMKASYYCLDMKNGGEKTQGVLTKDDIWYLRISTADNIDFYLRMDQAKRRW